MKFLNFSNLVGGIFGNLNSCGGLGGGTPISVLMSSVAKLAQGSEFQPPLSYLQGTHFTSSEIDCRCLSGLPPLISFCAMHLNKKKKAEN